MPRAGTTTTGPWSWTPSTKAETQALQIPAGTPVFIITRTAVSADGEPVEVNRMTVDASTHVLRYDFDA